MHGVESSTWRMLAHPPSRDVPLRGWDALWRRGLGCARQWVFTQNRTLRQAETIDAMQQRLKHLSNGRLRDQMAPLRERFRLGRESASDHRLALAIVCEVAARTVGLRPYREQIAAALSMEAGAVAEMATGEGKTLAAALSAVLAGWRGRGCHVITVNDYLVRRDATAMRAIYNFCGLTVGRILQGMAPTERKQAYNAHVTYCSNKEVAADFLRDRLLIGRLPGLPAVILSKMVDGRGAALDRLVQRGLACAIVDEADSVFVDEAVTPLLISGAHPNQDHLEATVQAARLADGLHPSGDYRIDRQHREVRLTPTGKHHLAQLAEPLGGLWAGSRRREELVLQALAARLFFIRDKQYVVAGHQVVIVDEFTGRLMPDRTWRNGLHQAIEAKEGLEITLPKETLARISFQRFFRRYQKLSGMTGTGIEAQAELWETYRLPVAPVPTHRPCRRVVLPDRVFTTAAAKWDAVVKAIVAIHQTGRPVLIGTRSIRESEYLSGRLTASAIPHQLLNAVRHESEARIIAGAGQKGQITVSTHMAGRGTDIRLGAGVAQLGGLHVIATQRAEARRIDRQLFGRCARQGDPGSAQAFISMEDALVEQHGPVVAAACQRFYGHADQEIGSAFWGWLIRALQFRAEGASYRMRNDVRAADSRMDHQLGFAANET